MKTAQQTYSMVWCRIGLLARHGIMLPAPSNPRSARTVAGTPRPWTPNLLALSWLLHPTVGSGLPSRQQAPARPSPSLHGPACSDVETLSATHRLGRITPPSPPGDSDQKRRSSASAAPLVTGGRAPPKPPPPRQGRPLHRVSMAAGTRTGWPAYTGHRSQLC